MRVLSESIAMAVNIANPGQPPVTVDWPHGAETGLDPHQAFQNITEENHFGYIFSPLLPAGSHEDNVRFMQACYSVDQRLVEAA